MTVLLPQVVPPPPYALPVLADGGGADGPVAPGSPPPPYALPVLADGGGDDGPVAPGGRSRGSSGSAVRPGISFNIIWTESAQNY